MKIKRVNISGMQPAQQPCIYLLILHTLQGRCCYNIDFKSLNFYLSNNLSIDMVAL